MASTNSFSSEALRQVRADRASQSAAKWPTWKTLLFIGAASLTLWLMILLAAMALLG